MAGDEVIMPENAFLMIHDPAGMVMGTATEMRAMAEALDKIKGSLLQGVGRPARRKAYSRMTFNHVSPASGARSVTPVAVR